MARSRKTADHFNPSDAESLAWDTRKRLIELTKAFESLQINKTRWLNLSHILIQQRNQFRELRKEIATLQLAVIAVIKSLKDEELTEAERKAIDIDTRRRHRTPRLRYRREDRFD
jgi:predicted kinase